MSDSKTSTMLIAHRGFSALETENTAAAFVAAGNRDYFGIETDVHVTRDGKFAIIHDDDTKRVAGVDFSVENSTFAELSKLKLNDKYGETRRDLVIPELSDYIKICKFYKKTAVLELKNPMTADSIRGITDCIKKYDYIENTVFVSFAFDNLVEVRKLYPDAAVQFLCGKISDELVNKLAEHRFDVAAYYEYIDKEISEKLHKHGIKINCYTVDSEKDAKRCLECGVDYITSNCLSELD